MSKLPILSGRDVVKAFSRAGWSVERTTGSHFIMTKAGRKEILSVPQHAEVKRGTLRGLIAAAGLSVEEFVGLL